MKKFILFGCLCLSFIHQLSAYDSEVVKRLKRQILETNSMQERCSIQLKLAWIIYPSSPDTLFFYADKVQRQAFSAYQNTQDDVFKELEGEALNAVGYYHYVIQNFEQAKTVLQKAKLRLSASKSKARTQNLNYLGLVLGEINPADREVIAKFDEALAIYTRQNDHEGMAQTYINKGQLFLQQREYLEAEMQFEKAKIQALQLKDRQMLGWVHYHQGKLAFVQNDLLQSETLLIKALKIWEAADHKRAQGLTLNLLGRIYVAWEDYEKGYSLQLSARELAEHMGDKRSEIDALINLSQFDLQAEQLSSAKENIQLAIKLAESIGDTEDEARAYLILSEVYEQQGLPMQAYYTLRQHTRLREKFTAYQAEILQTFQFDNERLKMEKQEASELAADRAIEKANLSRRSTIALASTVILSLIGLFTIFYLRSTREKLAIQKRLNEGLEKEVALRTEEIEQQKDELRLSNTFLKEINGEKDSLISLVAHDLGVPLATIQMYSDMIRRKAADLNDKNRKYLDKISELSHSASVLVRQILDVNAIEKGMKASVSKQDLIPHLHNAVQDIVPVAEQKGISISMPPPGIQFTASFDGTFLKQIMQNLLSNAVKFSPMGTKVALLIDEDESGKVNVMVADEGPGIPPADMEKLFLPYTKLTNKPTNGEVSNGFGLAAVKKLSEKMGARINCESEVGKGSTFILTLPG